MQLVQQSEDGDLQNLSLNQIISNISILIRQSKNEEETAPSFESIEEFHEKNKQRERQLRKKLSTVFEEELSSSSEHENQTHLLELFPSKNHKPHIPIRDGIRKKITQTNTTKLMKKITGLRKRMPLQAKDLNLQISSRKFQQSQHEDKSFKETEECIDSQKEKEFNFKFLHELSDLSAANQKSMRKSSRKGLSICGTNALSPSNSSVRRILSNVKSCRRQENLQSPKKEGLGGRKSLGIKMKEKRKINVYYNKTGNGGRGEG